jgi:hypothetical protein
MEHAVAEDESSVLIRIVHRALRCPSPLRYKICDSFDVPSSLSSSSSSCSGSFRIDCLGESLLCFRAPKEHPWKDEGVKEGEVVVLVEASLSGLDPRAQLFECGPSNRKVKRWISQEINRMVFAWHHDANHSDASTSPDPSDATPSIVQPPQWDIPLIKGMDESWNYHGRVTHEIACHIQVSGPVGEDVSFSPAAI